MRYRTTVDFGPLIRGVLAYDAAVPRITRNDFDNVELGFARHYACRRRAPTSFAFERSEGFERFQRFDAFSSVDGGTVSMAVDDDEGAVALHGTGLAMQFRIRAALAFTAFACLVLWFFTSNIWISLGVFVALIIIQCWLIMRSMDAKLSRWITGATLH